MTVDRAVLGEACRVLGGLALDGANPALVAELQEACVARRLAQLPGDAGAAFGGLDRAVRAEPAARIAADYTNLMVATSDGQARQKLAVPPWEDCWVGRGRQVMGERARAALVAYSGAGLGFDGMKERPADHIGLELCFVAALLAEELDGARDDGTRRAFVRDHLEAFGPKLGEALSASARTEFWREVGRAIRALPTLLA